MTRRLLIACFAVVSIATSIRAEEPLKGGVPDVVSIERMKKDLFYLAGPECNGRGVGTPGIDKAADRIVAEFKAAGLKPAMKDGTYFQPFSIAGPTVATAANVTFQGPGGQKLALKLNKQFRAIGVSGSGESAGGVVFAGYGITTERQGKTFDEYDGIDCQGKLVIVLRKTPRPNEKGEKDPFDKNENPEYATLAAKVKLAEKSGAAAIAFVNDRSLANDGDELMAFRYVGAQSASKLPVFQINRGTVDHLLTHALGTSLVEIEQAIEKDLKPRSAVLNGWTATTNATIKKNDFACKNVVGVLEGNGPLANETVVVGAHYDHLGTSSYGSMVGPAGEGQVHFGADDNASGTTGMIEMARRFAAMKDRQGRRIVFIAFSGEERGLHGSIHYCKEPIYPLEETAFMLNMDMIGRVKEVEFEKGGKGDRLLVYGTGTAEGFDKLVDDKNPGFKIIKLPAGTGPSDHDSFYRKKVPVIFFFTGTHSEYHRPNDTPDRINLAGMKKVVDYGFNLTAYAAEVKEKPKYTITKERFVDPTEERRPSTPRMSGPTLGIMPSYEEGETGVKVDGISPGGAAEKAGLKDGDIITEVNGKPVTNVTTYMSVMNTQKGGVEIEITIKRKGEKKTLKITPMERK
jgi:hypothetical protein